MGNCLLAVNLLYYIKANWLESFIIWNEGFLAFFTKILSSVSGFWENWGTHSLSVVNILARDSRQAKQVAKCFRALAGACFDVHILLMINTYSARNWPCYWKPSIYIALRYMISKLSVATALNILKLILCKHTSKGSLKVHAGAAENNLIGHNVAF